MSKKVKQMSYISMIVFIIGTTIGAGIFYKNQNIAALAHGHFGPVLATWGVAIFGIIALAVALVEVSSAQKTDKGTLEWTKLFTPKWFHKSSTNFVKWMFIPLALFTMPLYVMESLQDAGWDLHQGITVLAISFALFAWFMIINLISFRFAEISQWVFTAIQTVPLIVLPIVAYAHPIPHDLIMTKEITDTSAIQIPKGINGISPWISLIAGVSAITFAYDGFYVIASMKEKTSGKAKMGVGLVIGVSAISAIYLFLTIAFNVGSTDGTHLGIQWAALDHPEFMKAMNACIAIGIMGILNGFAMGSPRQFRALAESGEAKEINWLHKFLFRKKLKQGDKKQLEFAGWFYLFAVSTILFLTLGMIGVYAYKLNDYSFYGSQGTLYTFSDHIVNFTCLLMFIIITTSILGALRNRKTNAVEVKKSKFFVPAAWIAIVVFYSAGAYMVGASLLDMFNVTGDLKPDQITSSIIKFVIFVGILAISVIPAFSKEIKGGAKFCWGKMKFKKKVRA